MNLARYAVRLMRFQAGPEDAPSLVVPAGVFYTGTGLAALNAQGFMQASVPALAFAETILLASFVFMLLQVFNKPARWAQTITALFIAGICLNLLSLSLALAVPAIPALAPLSFALLFWYLALFSSILQSSTGVAKPLAIALALVYQLSVMMFLPWPKPVEPEQPPVPGFEASSERPSAAASHDSTDSATTRSRAY